eukprot:12422082-Ditylum_brightwellii.AAC.1
MSILLFNVHSIRRHVSSKKKNEAGVDFNGHSNGVNDNFPVLTPTPPPSGKLILLPLALMEHTRNSG